MTTTKTEAKWQQMGLLEPLPDYLLPYVYEVVRGKPVFYKGYQEFILLTKQPQEMGSSSLQSRLITLLILLLGKKGIAEKFDLFTSELGILLSKNNSRCLDLAIYEKNEVLIDKHYSKIPPKVVIEVDIDADLSNYENDVMSYYQEKTTDLLNFGVERVIWIFTESKNVVVATQKSPWEIYQLGDTVNIIDDCNFCLKELIEKN